MNRYNLFNNLRHVLGLEVNSAGGLSSKEKLEPLSSASWDCEKVDSSSHVAKGLCHPGVSVSYLNLDFVFHVHDLDVHKLKHPVWISATTLTNRRSPFSSVHSYDDIRIHTFEKLIGVIQMSFFQV